MAIVKMQKLSICATKKHRKAILEFLQSMGAMEVHTENLNDPELKKMDTQASRSTFLKNADALEQAAGLLKAYHPEKKSGLSLFSEKKEVERKTFDTIADDQQTYVGDARAILKAEKTINECKTAVSRDRNLIDSLQPWMRLDIPMSYRGTRDTVFYVGTIEGEIPEADLLAAVTAGMQDPVPVSVDVLDTGHNVTYLSVLCHKKVQEQVEANLREAGFARPSQPVKGIPSEEAERAEKDIRAQEENIAKQKEKIIRHYGKRGRLLVLSDYYRTRAEKYRLLGTIPQSEKVFFLEGWIPDANVKEITEILTGKFHAVVETEEKEPDETEPTLLKNNHFSESVEGVLASYGLPQHGKVDPTFLMSIFYVFFFGMMLSDAAYGIIISVICGIVLKKHRHLEKGLQKTLRLFFYCGLSTAFWGFMYGSFFGDAIDVIAKTFFGYTGATPILKPLWFEPLGDPMRLLMYCMLFGLIHLFTGLGIKGYQMLRDHDMVGFISDILAWYMFLLGLILLLLPTSLFESIAGMEFNFPSWMHGFSLVLTFAGMGIILVMSGRDHKNWALRIILGAYDIYGVTSWLSDVLSYSRLLALGLATGVIASVVNMIGSMFGGGPAGAVVFILIFVFGHTMNLLINLLGAYVHSNRLEFVEFFGKFYDAGGQPFQPFSTKNKYIEIKEEKVS